MYNTNKSGPSSARSGGSSSPRSSGRPSFNSSSSTGSRSTGAGRSSSYAGGQRSSSYSPRSTGGSSSYAPRSSGSSSYSSRSTSSSSSFAPRSASPSPSFAPRSNGGSSYSSRSTGGSSSYAPRSASSSSSSSFSPRSSSSYSGGSSSYAGGSSSYAGGGSRFGGANAGGRRSGYGSSSRSSGGGFRGRRSFSSGPRLDVSKFINKASVIEEVAKYIPEHSFKDFAIEENLKKNILEIGYDLPTPIQDKAIPHVLKGADVVGIAATGTGKTAAFLIPLIHKVLVNPKEEVLIVVPTRELALQIQDELRKFTASMKVYSVCCVGGAPIGKQISALAYVNQFVIGTPGRIKDLIKRRKLDLSYFKTVVLDEADRMLDMGFVADMKFMMDLMPKDRQTLFFSATISKEIELLINDFLNQPVRISVKTRDTSANVDQDVIRVGGGKDKLEMLHDLLNKEDFSKVIIFGRTKHGVEKLSQALAQKGFKVDSIHGDKNQGQRQRALSNFKNDQVQILVATDVAARGLDIPDVSHVINYELPATFDDYVHRIGRTGRANKTGKALTFIG